MGRSTGYTMEGDWDVSERLIIQFSFSTSLLLSLTLTHIHTHRQTQNQTQTLTQTRKRTHINFFSFFVCVLFYYFTQLKKRCPQNRCCCNEQKIFSKLYVPLILIGKYQLLPLLERSSNKGAATLIYVLCNLCSCSRSLTLPSQISLHHSIYCHFETPWFNGNEIFINI